jgi:hypothetical protein
MWPLPNPWDHDLNKAESALCLSFSGQVVLEKKFFQRHHLIFVIIYPLKWTCPFILTNLNFLPRSLYKVTLKLTSWFRRSFLQYKHTKILPYCSPIPPLWTMTLINLNLHYIIFLKIISPLRRSWSFICNFEFSLPKDDLYQFWLKLANWIRRIFFKNMFNLFFLFYYYFPLDSGQWHSVGEVLNPLYLKCFMPALVKIGLSVLEKK